jgi:hypothetical protein
MAKNLTKRDQAILRHAARGHSLFVDIGGKGCFRCRCRDVDSLIGRSLLTREGTVTEAGEIALAVDLDAVKEPAVVGAPA